MRLIIFFFIIFSTLCSSFNMEACTSAIIGAKASRYGRPLLWKHRDTSAIDNKVEYIAPKNGDAGYVALFNADDKKLEQAWMGMNDYGFAVMNTASYNLKNDNVSPKKMDREGYVMTIALRTCKSVDDFEKLLKSLPRPMGVEANFGVIDAYGNGAYFETSNDSFIKYDLADSDNNVIVRTNYSHSGRKNEGFGFIREKNAEHLLESAVAECDVTPELMTEVLSRSFWHSLKEKDYGTPDGEQWVVDQDFIPRFKSTATIVIEGCKPLPQKTVITPGMLKDEYIMWTGLGYPPCSEIVPVWCSKDGVDDNLRGIGPNGHAPLADIAKERRAEVFPFKKGNGDKYINMRKLFNSESTGYVQTLVPRNLETYRLIRKKRDHKRDNK